MMNRLISHIERCVSIHKCVVVPSLGGFVSELLPAHFDREDNLIYPPGEELRFNAALSLRDGILEDSYASAYGISHRRARVMLDDDVRALRAELVRVGRVSLDKMGELTLNSEGQVTYLSSNQQEDGSGFSYGLFPCSLPQLVDSSLSLSSEKVSEEQPKDKDYLYFKIHKRATTIAAAVVLMVASFFIPWEHTSSSDKFTASFVPSELTAKQVWQDIEMQLGQRDIPEISDESLGAVDETAVDKEQTDDISNDLATDVAEGGVPVMHEPVGASYYYVVVGTFSTKAKAQDFYREEIDRDLMPNALVLLSRNKARIYAERFLTADEAHAYIRSMRSQDKLFADAWVYAGR